MYQTATLLGRLGHGLSSRHHPIGGSIYAVRDDAVFLYIGKTVNRVWQHMSTHVRSDDLLWRAVRAHAPHSSLWRIEVCNFGGEQGLLIVERELIRRHRPRLNIGHNTGRPRTAVEQLQLANRQLIGPAGLAVIDHGWPSFAAIDLELPRFRRRSR